MALSRDVVLSRQAPEKIVLENQNFARWLSRRKGVSAAALSSAMALLSNGLIEALGEGYTVRLWGIGTFELREMPPRRRYHRLNKEVYISPATTLVHFKKSENLNAKVRNKAQARLEKMLEKSSVPLVVKK